MKKLIMKIDDTLIEECPSKELCSFFHSEDNEEYDENFYYTRREKTQEEIFENLKYIEELEDTIYRLKEDIYYLEKRCKEDFYRSIRIQISKNNKI